MQNLYFDKYVTVIDEPLFVICPPLWCHMTDHLICFNLKICVSCCNFREFAEFSLDTRASLELFKSFTGAEYVAAQRLRYVKYPILHTSRITFYPFFVHKLISWTVVDIVLILHLYGTVDWLISFIVTQEKNNVLPYGSFQKSWHHSDSYNWVCPCPFCLACFNCIDFFFLVYFYIGKLYLG